jgi:uncharacterized membrane protein YdfJ with MMPL/SSD domain
MDYDIFLVSRVREFRQLGWSDRASVCLAVEATGGVITAAGLIMCVSFCGLLIPKTVVLNQYGFTLFIGVAFDTFLMRPIIVPAIIAILGSVSSRQLNWYPSKMPPQLLSEEEEEHALAAGCVAPQELAALRAALEAGDAVAGKARDVTVGEAVGEAMRNGGVAFRDPPQADVGSEAKAMIVIR